MRKSGNREVGQFVAAKDGSAEALEKFRRPLLTYLISANDEQDKRVRYLAIQMLGTLRDPVAGAHLTRLLTDNDADVRAVSAEALDSIGNSNQAFTRLQNSACDTCLIRIIAQEALAFRDAHPQGGEG